MKVICDQNTICIYMINREGLPNCPAHPSFCHASIRSYSRKKKDNIYANAMLFLISAIAKPGFRPLGHVLEQFIMVWQRYRLMLLFSASWRSAVFSSRESAIQRYDWRRTAGPRYSSWFHQYEGHDVEQHAHRMHSYRPSSFLRSALLCRYSLPCSRVISKSYGNKKDLDD